MSNGMAPNTTRLGRFPDVKKPAQDVHDVEYKFIMVVFTLPLEQSKFRLFL